MDFLFITIVILWLIIETIMFFIQNGKGTKTETVNSQILYELNNDDSNESRNFPYSEKYECDSGINSTSTEESETSYAFMQFSRKKISNEKIAEMEKRKKRAMSKQLACQERDRKQLEQYLKAKFTPKTNPSLNDMLNLLYNIVQYIRKYKIISLEDMALNFKLRPQEIVEHIKNLQMIGIITGVLDDRGKYIYVPERESKAVGRFIQQQRFYHWPQKAFI